MMAERVFLERFSRPEAETCEYIGERGIYWSKGPVLMHSPTLGGPCAEVARLPRPFLRRTLSVTRLGRRLARETFYNVIPLANGSVFFTYATDIGVITADGAVTPITGRERSHRVLRGGAAILPDGSVVFGEYFDNAERDPVKLYRLEPGETAVTEVYRFEPGEVRHVHSVRWDPFSSRAIVCTGDIKDECRIIAMAPDFSAHEVLGSGSEDWRTISPQFSAEAVYFGTDAQFFPNGLMRYDRATGALSELARVNGPVFYSAALPGGWLFATTAELCPSQISPEAILYYIDAASEAVSTVARFEKDHLSTRYFQFGIVNLPLSDAPQSRLPISGVALKELDGIFTVLS